MEHQAKKTFAAFLGTQLFASGSLSEVALALRANLRKKPNLMPLVFEDETGNQVELDLRGTAAEVKARYTDKSPSEEPAPSEVSQPATGRGRPRLGVIAREVTLLPDHWNWLASQPGGASVALRKLVHEAKQVSAERDLRRRIDERTYKVMVALAGNLPKFEDASRALFAGELDRMATIVKAWPADIKDYVIRLAKPEPSKATDRS